MRLIDADELQERMLRYYGDYSFNICEEIRDFFQNTPTVEAIPVEWIKKWCNEHNRKSLEERLLKRYGVITMLEDWEKENEKDI